MSDLKILMTADAIGGVWQYSADLAETLGQSGVETVIALLGPAPSEAQRRHVAGLAGVTLIETGLPVDWLCDGPAPVLAAGEAIARLARQEGVDLLHLNMPTLAASVADDLPIVAVTHGCVATWWRAARGTPLDAGYAWHRELMAEGLRAADRVVAPSRGYAEAVAAEYGIAAPAVVHNGRQTVAVADAAEPVGRALTVGRLWDDVKNARLLDRVAAIAATPIDAAGPVQGPHGEGVALSHMAALGTVAEAELARRLAERPLFVSAASFEPFGLAVLEAAAAGCALILSDIATFRELWDGAALFVPGTDERDWAQAIDGLAADRRARAMLGEAARERARRYTPEACAAGMCAIYDTLAGATEARKAA